MKLHSLYILLALVFLSSGCRKERPGKNGRATINAHAVNGQINAGITTFKLMYGGELYQGANAAYHEIVESDFKGLYSFKNLGRGKYYLYAETQLPDTLLQAGVKIVLENSRGETHIVVDFSKADPIE